MTATTPYGAWTSPITTELLTQGAVQLSPGGLDSGEVWFAERRPAEGGRTVVCRAVPGEQPRDVLAAPWNARSRVHEYGGGAWSVRDGVVVFVDMRDQQIYRVDAPLADPVALTETPDQRYGGLSIGPDGWVYAVREDHGASIDEEPENTLIRVPLDGSGEMQALHSGTDFVGAPAIHPDGTQVAYVVWNHPNMPWDTTSLRVSTLDADGVTATRTIPTTGEESFTEPSFAPDGTLFFLTDRTGFWNLYRDGGDADPQIVHEDDAEFAGPAWQLSGAGYGFTSDGSILCSYLRDGLARLALIDPATGQRTEVEDPGTSFNLSLSGSQVVLHRSRPDAPTELVLRDLNNLEGDEVQVAVSSRLPIDAAYMPMPQPWTWRNSQGMDVHGLYYPPTNPDCAAPEGDLPPLIVMAHGGPTAHVEAAMSLELAFWTSRGFAVLHVNYSGSTGYGREYRNRLRGQWGIIDTDDCVTGALSMADAGHVDRERLLVRGGSAGGYLVYQVLTMSDVFAAGCSLFGVADVEALALHTHKFESRYPELLIAPYPEGAEVYRKRSAIHNLDKLTAPMILLQGTEDRIVPPEQTLAMADAVRGKGLPVSVLMFEGEAHGFVDAKNIRRALEAELSFYGQVLGFTPADEMEPVEVENLPGI